jgi:hypothetical protein
MRAILDATVFRTMQVSRQTNPQAFATSPSYYSGTTAGTKSVDFGAAPERYSRGIQIQQDAVTEESRPLTLVQNWPAELKK